MCQFCNIYILCFHNNVKYVTFHTLKQKCVQNCGKIMTIWFGECQYLIALGPAGVDGMVLIDNGSTLVNDCEINVNQNASAKPDWMPTNNCHDKLTNKVQIVFNLAFLKCWQLCLIWHQFRGVKGHRSVV